MILSLEEIENVEFSETDDVWLSVVFDTAGDFQPTIWYVYTLKIPIFIRPHLTQ